MVNLEVHPKTPKPLCELECLFYLMIDSDDDKFDPTEYSASSVLANSKHTNV